MKGYFVKRYNRFLVDIETQSKKTVTAYCPATGRMTSCLRDGALCEYIRVEDRDRRLDYDWWSIKMPSSWIVIDTRPANRWLYWYRTAPFLPNSWTDADWKAEPRLPDGGRLDFRLERSGGQNAWIEIKSVTWCEDGVGLFPDAPTERGRRHLRKLIELSDGNSTSYVIFVCMRSDIEEIRPAKRIDPDFCQLLRTARTRGVKLIGLESSVDDRSLELTGTVPVILN